LAAVPPLLKHTLLFFQLDRDTELTPCEVTHGGEAEVWFVLQFPDDDDCVLPFFFELLWHPHNDDPPGHLRTVPSEEYPEEQDEDAPTIS